MPRSHLKAMSSAWWDEIKNLFRFASDSLHSLDGQCVCFELQTEGSAIETQDSVLIRVQVLQQLEGTIEATRFTAGQVSCPAQKAVLRMPYAVWNLVGSKCSRLRALWSQVRIQQDIIILDATVGNAFITGDVVLQDFENVRVAELFCGVLQGGHKLLGAYRTMASSCKLHGCLTLRMM